MEVVVGQRVQVVGFASRSGFLVVNLGSTNIHVPHQLTEVIPVRPVPLHFCRNMPMYLDLFRFISGYACSSTVCRLVRPFLISQMVKISIFVKDSVAQR